MRIVITDENLIWRYDNPMFEPYKDKMLVVCIYGKEVTDKYENFVCPKFDVGLGADRYDYSSNVLRNLLSVADELVFEFGNHDDIIFLTDSDPMSLFPYIAAKDHDHYNRLHLCAIRPFFFESKNRVESHNRLLSDLTKVKSLLYMDPNPLLRDKDKKITMPDLLKKMEEACVELLPRILYGIQEKNWDRGFFDFYTRSYLPLKDGYDLVEEALKHQEIDPKLIIDYEKTRLMGVPIRITDPGRGKLFFDSVESPIPRIDGKKICNYLRGLRLLLARANNIDFSSEECPVVGPCAGTCEKCDRESAYLRDEMGKISEQQRIYPDETLKEWEGLS